MHRLIFIFMIALLPLRGWMGEAMATTMAIDEIAINFIVIKTGNTPAKADLSAEKSMSDCDMHKTNLQDDSNAKPSCTACQACNVAGSLTTTVQTHSAIKVQYAHPLAQISHYASANLALGQKPPIL